MSIGDRRHLLTVQRKASTKDSRGAEVEHWADRFQVYGAFEPIGTREFPSFQKMNSETTARFRIPAGPAIDADKDRILMIEDYSTSPPLTSIWDIEAPTPVHGKPFERHVEAVRIT